MGITFVKPSVPKPALQIRNSSVLLGKWFNIFEFVASSFSNTRVTENER